MTSSSADRPAAAQSARFPRMSRVLVPGLFLSGLLLGSLLTACGSADSGTDTSSAALGGVAGRDGGYRALIEDRRLLRRPNVDLAAGGVASTPWGAEITVLPGTGQGEVFFTGTAGKIARLV